MQVLKSQIVCMLKTDIERMKARVLGSVLVYLFDEMLYSLAYENQEVLGNPIKICQNIRIENNVYQMNKTPSLIIELNLKCIRNIFFESQMSRICFSKLEL